MKNDVKFYFRAVFLRLPNEAKSKNLFDFLIRFWYGCLAHGVACARTSARARGPKRMRFGTESVGMAHEYPGSELCGPEYNTSHTHQNTGTHTYTHAHKDTQGGRIMKRKGGEAEGREERLSAFKRPGGVEFAWQATLCFVWACLDKK